VNLTIPLTILHEVYLLNFKAMGFLPFFKSTDHFLQCRYSIDPPDRQTHPPSFKRRHLKA